MVVNSSSVEDAKRQVTLEVTFFPFMAGGVLYACCAVYFIEELRASQVLVKL